MKMIDASESESVYQRSKNGVLGFELKPGYTNSNPDFIANYERTNTHGQRDRERTIQKPTGVKRILLLGDSVVEGYGLPEADTISSQLESIYEKANTQSVEVLNFGVSAYCTLAETELLATKGVQFDPDVVVMVFVENDFDNFNREAFSLGGLQRPAAVEWLFKRSKLFQMLCLQLNLFQFRIDADPVQWNADAIGDNNVAAGLGRFRELADEHQFQPLVAIWPKFRDDSITDEHFVPDTDVQIVEALAAQHRLPTFRLSSYFQQQQTSTSPRLEFSQGDSLHPSPRGAKVAAASIHEVLEQGIDQIESLGAAQQVADEKLSTAIASVPQETPNYARVYTRLGDEHAKRREYELAIEQYRKALGEDPQNAVTHNNLGIALERNNDQQNALSHYRKAIEALPDFAEAHFNLGNALERQNQQDAAAQKHYIRAVTIKPNFVKAHFSLSRWLIRNGRKRAGEAGLRQVLKLEPTNAEALLLLGNELAKQQRAAEAREVLERYLAVDPINAEVLNNLGAICVALGDRSNAVRYFQDAMAADPNHPTAKSNLERLGP